jgi:hypothetical protein
MTLPVFTRVLCFFAAVAVLSACKSIPVEENTLSERESTLIAAVYKGVDEIISNQNKYPIARAKNKVKVLTTSLANLENLEKTSPFGLIVAEQVSSRLAQLGVSTTEVKFTGKLFISSANGELVMSREARAISSEHNADLILVGSYIEGASTVYVNLKLIRAQDSEISSAYNFVVSKGPDLEHMLGKGPSRSK